MPYCCCCFHGCCQICDFINGEVNQDPEKTVQNCYDCSIKDVLCFCCINYMAHVHNTQYGQNRFLQSLIVLAMGCVTFILGILIIQNFTLLGSLWMDFQTIGAPHTQLIYNQAIYAIAVYELPSTNEGCSCPDNEFGDSWVEQGSCTTGELAIGCQTTSAKEPVELKFWSQPTIDNEFITVQICGLKSKQTFLDQLKKGIFDSNDCEKNNLKVCDSNNPNNVVCVEQDEQCPITDLKISLYELSPYELSKGSYIQIYNDKFYAYVSKKLGDTPLTQSIVVKGRGVCVFKNQLSQNPKSTYDYQLNSIISSDCILDERYKSISKTYEDKLFSSNNFLEYIQPLRPFYEVNAEIEYQWMIANQITYQPSCRSSNFVKLQNISNNYDQTKYLQVASLTISLPFSVLMSAIVYIQLRGNLDEGLYCCIIGVQWIFQYAFSILLFIVYDQMMTRQENLKQQTDLNCFDSFTQDQLKLTLELNQSTVLNLMGILFIIILVVDTIDFIFTIYYVCNACQGHRSNQEFQASLKAESADHKQRISGNQCGSGQYTNQNEQYEQQLTDPAQQFQRHIFQKPKFNQVCPNNNPEDSSQNQQKNTKKYLPQFTKTKKNRIHKMVSEIIILKYMKQKLIIIAGLTASGKSDCAQYIANSLNTKIIVGDSLQMYKNWRIASNWPNNQQQYNLLGTIDGNQSSLNAAQYKNLVEDQMKKYSNCLIEGGCCFYLNYLLNSGKERFTEQQISEADKKAEGLINLSQDVQQLLQQHCTSYDKSISSNDYYRITKALRYALLSNGEYFKNNSTDPSDTINQQYDIRGIFLSGSQDYINQRIYLRYGILYYHLMQLDVIEWSNGGVSQILCRIEQQLDEENSSNWIC